MPIERWQSLAVYEPPAPPAPPPAAPVPPPFAMSGLWLRVIDLLPAKRLIRIVATGTWSDLRGGTAVGPDGYLDLSLTAEHLIYADAPLGALIGKIGGSTADKITGDKTTGDKKIEGITLFPIGTYCVVAPIEKAAPLFVAVNGAWSLPQFRFLTLRIDVSTAEP
jgi:hypothetical protein